MAYTRTLKKDGSPLRNKTKAKTPESQRRRQLGNRREEGRRKLRKTDTEKEGGRESGKKQLFQK